MGQELLHRQCSWADGGSGHPAKLLSLTQALLCCDSLSVTQPISSSFMCLCEEQAELLTCR